MMTAPSTIIGKFAAIAVLLMALRAMAEDDAPDFKLLRFGPSPQLRQLFEQSDAVAILMVKLSFHRLGRLELTVETLYKEGEEPYNSRQALRGFALSNDPLGKEYMVWCIAMEARQRD